MLQEVNIKYRDRQNTETIYLPNSCPHCGNIIWEKARHSSMVVR